MNNLKDAVLQILKLGHLLSAREIEIRLGLVPQAGQKPVRTAIDGLRARGEPIWKDAKGFWWRDDQATLPTRVRTH